MSSFAALKDKRRARQGPSFASTSSASPAAVPAEPVVPAPFEPIEPVSILGASTVEDTKLYVYGAGMYKDLPEYLEIRVSQTRGRGIYVKEGTSVKAGTSLMKVKPHAYSLSTPNLDAHCASCLLNPQSSLSPEYQVTQLRRCTGCLAVSYCSSECQKYDWKGHKEECRALKALRSHGDQDPGMPGEAVRALGRLVWTRKRVGGDTAWWTEVEHMQSNITLLNPRQHEPLAMLGLAVCRYLGITPQQSSPEETARKLDELGFPSIRNLTNFLSRFQTNSFSLTTPDLTNVGVAVSPLAALISHSCMPNAAVVFPTGLGRRGALEVIALRDLQSGEEILTSYLDVALPRAERQKELKERYLFDCECTLCTRELDPDWIDPRSAVRCRTEGCTAKLRMPQPGTTHILCNTCGTGFAIDAVSLQQHIQLGTAALQKADSLQFSDPAKARYLLVSVLRNLTPLARSSYPLLSILQLLQQLFITAFSVLPFEDPERDRFLQDAATCAALVFAGMDDVYPPGHPTKGVQSVTMAKLLMAEISDSALAPSPATSSLPADMLVLLPMGVCRLRMALELLSKASRDLRLGFGKDGGLVGKDASLLAVGLEREISMWSALRTNRRIR
ncbi:SET domain-containing protein [Calocera viscosa TUFC12733]|uniref:SET domain-containing protein n=1 Tax=Calocera viscosa (strain TUFC12733) TaxID=1330018 RepID=A0A167J6V2_CALVF|nr:SET domain-containing protein [Calocera viscosa TUFC12733]